MSTPATETQVVVDGGPVGGPSGCRRVLGVAGLTSVPVEEVEGLVSAADASIAEEGPRLDRR